MVAKQARLSFCIIPKADSPNCLGSHRVSGGRQAEECPCQFVHLPERDLETLTQSVRNPNLKLTLSFGFGIHHAGLTEKDRRLVEELFVNQKIQVLVATATLAW